MRDFFWRLAAWRVAQLEELVNHTAACPTPANLAELQAALAHWGPDRYNRRCPRVWAQAQSVIYAGRRILLIYGK